jgi:hypothetical protein
MEEQVDEEWNGLTEDAAGEMLPDEEAKGGKGPTLEQLIAWQSRVATTEKSPVWKDHLGGRFQQSCFAVEWRGSVLLDRQEFVRHLFGVIGGDASFVLGVEARQTRADYRVVVRLNAEDRVRWRDWRKMLIFGHGGEGEREGSLMRVQVPRGATDEGRRKFVLEMTRRCELYTNICRYQDAGMGKLQDKGYARPGRKKRAPEGSEQVNWVRR